MPWAEDTNTVRPFCKADQDQAMKNRMADDDFPELLCRVCFVVEDASQRIAEHRSGFLETNAVLLEITVTFSLVPLKLHKPSIALLAASCQGFR